MRRLIIILLFFIVKLNLLAQVSIKMNCFLDPEANTIKIDQEIIYKNQSNAALNHIILNDWNQAFSNKKTELAKRFSDEFVRSFYFAPTSDLGFTDVYSVKNQDNNLKWERVENDFVKINLDKALLPNDEIKINLNYQVKIPNARFTRYGFQEDSFVLNDWFLVPAVLSNNEFLMQPHSNTDDKVYPKCDYDITFNLPENYKLNTCLENKDLNNNTIQLTGKNILHFSLYVESNNSFQYFVNNDLTIATNIENLVNIHTQK
jgi:hypothetical protein